MNPKTDTPSQDAPGQTEPNPNVNAKAIEQARKRVQERQRQAELENNRRRRESGHWGSGDGIWDVTDFLTARLMLSLLLAGGGLLISGVLWLTQNLRWPAYYLLWGLDAMTGARSLPMAPWLAWTVWGAVFGGAVGYWLVAPLYSERENRSMILWLPLLGMATIALLLWCFTP